MYFSCSMRKIPRWYFFQHVQLVHRRWELQRVLPAFQQQKTCRHSGIPRGPLRRLMVRLDYALLSDGSFGCLWFRRRSTCGHVPVINQWDRLSLFYDHPRITKYATILLTLCCNSATSDWAIIALACSGPLQCSRLCLLWNYQHHQFINSRLG